MATVASWHTSHLPHILTLPCPTPLYIPALYSGFLPFLLTPFATCLRTAAATPFSLPLSHAHGVVHCTCTPRSIPSTFLVQASQVCSCRHSTLGLTRWPRSGKIMDRTHTNSTGHPSTRKRSCKRSEVRRVKGYSCRSLDSHALHTGLGHILLPLAAHLTAHAALSLINLGPPSPCTQVWSLTNPIMPASWIEVRRRIKAPPHLRHTFALRSLPGDQARD